MKINPNLIKLGKVLWSNSNPTSTFNAQTITLSSSDYDVLEIFCAMGTSTGDGITSGKGIKGKNILVNCLAPTATVSPMRVRNFSYVSDTSLSVGIAYYGTNALTSTSNAYVIPLYVVGYKTGIF